MSKSTNVTLGKILLWELVKNCFYGKMLVEKITTVGLFDAEQDITISVSSIQ